MFKVGERVTFSLSGRNTYDRYVKKGLKLNVVTCILTDRCLVSYSYLGKDYDGLELSNYLIQLDKPLTLEDVI